MNYYLNEKTKRYHLEGLCQYNSPREYKKFATEKALMDYVGGQAIICKTCQKKREKMI